MCSLHHLETESPILVIVGPILVFSPSLELPLHSEGCA